MFQPKGKLAGKLDNVCFDPKSGVPRFRKRFTGELSKDWAFEASPSLGIETPPFGQADIRLGSVAALNSTHRDGPLGAKSRLATVEQTAVGSDGIGNWRSRA